MSLLHVFKKPPAKQKNRLSMVLNSMQMLLVEQRSRFIDRDRDLDTDYDHISESLRYAKMFALSRKLDPDLAACAVAVQNIGRIVTGKTENHAEAGYELARKLFSNLGCFDPQEIYLLANSVRNHSRKDKVDSPLDELAKDVDIYVRYIQGHEFTQLHDIRRLSAIRLEIQKRIAK